MSAPPAPNSEISVLCVDDNEQVAIALRMKFGSIGGFEWRGWLSAADSLVPTVLRDKPGIVLLDIDMPGRDPFDALAELTNRCPRTRVVIFSGHVRRDLVDRALDAGAWGYVSKNDGEESLVHAVRQVAAGELTLSPEARMSCDA
jgi:two-component system, NarL family, response regulator DesR